jgi:hypothetical protein
MNPKVHIYGHYIYTKYCQGMWIEPERVVEYIYKWCSVCTSLITMNVKGLLKFSASRVDYFNI